jgi:hypothetical protein
VQRNASLWADVFLVKQGYSPDPSSPKFNPRAVHHLRKGVSHYRLRSIPSAHFTYAALTRYMPKQRIRKEKNLLSSKPTDEPEVVEEVRSTDT